MTVAGYVFVRIEKPTGMDTGPLFTAAEIEGAHVGCDGRFQGVRNGCEGFQCWWGPVLGPKALVPSYRCYRAESGLVYLYPLALWPGSDGRIPCCILALLSVQCEFAYQLGS